MQSLQAELSSNLRAVPGAQVAFNTLENSAQGLGRRQALKLLSSAVDLDYNAQQRLIKLTRGEIIVTCGGIDEGSSFDRPLRVKSR